MHTPRTILQPQQRLPYRQKTKQWRKDNLDYADGYSFYNNEAVRKSLRNKIINYNLYDGILDMEDLVELVNPYHMDASFIPDKIPHHPIMSPKIDLLLGEEIKRRFDWAVIVTNQDAISEKEKAKKDVLFQKLQEMVTQGLQDEEIEAKWKEFEDFMKYDWQDIRERMANQILKHYWEEQNFADIFNKCFKDALISGEELIQVDIVHGEPVLSKLNGLKVFSMRSGNSDRIEDSQMIIIEDHWSPGKIIDYFHEELKPEDIDYINDYTNHKGSSKYSDDQNNHTLLRDALDSHTGKPFIDEMFSIANINGHMFSSNLTDEHGNIRVFRVYWKSLKKMKKVKYYDEFGEEQYKIRTEEYIIDENRGEESTTIWINEWWEGTKIGKDIYLSMKPRDIQYNKANNPSYCHPGIIGQVYNTNQGRAVSLVDRCKNYQYLYNIMWDRLNKAIATNYGKIFELDLAKVPENWEIEKWLHFAVVNKIAVVDSFKEGNHGAATGKLAGGFNTSGGRAIDMETGQYIQMHIQMLEFIKTEMGEIAGVSRQREGQINNSETVGGVERSVNQSSHITEYWFSTHEQFKLRVLTAFLETAKIALRGNNKKVQYILDDLSIQMLNIDGETFSEADYGLVCSNSSKTTELEANMKQLAQAFMQNGGSMSTIMDIYMSSGIADMRKKIEIAEDKINQQNSKAQEDQNKLAQQAQEQALQLETTKLELEEAKSIREDETKRYIAELGLLKDSQNNEGNDGIIDEATSQKLDIDREKIKNDKLIKLKKLADDMKMHNDKMQKEDKKIAVQKINKNKPNK